MTTLSMRRQAALLLVSAALLAFQIILLQILATSQWHHFAYLVISIALLGFGAAGTTLSLAREWILAREELLLPLLLCACAVTLAGSLAFIESLFGGFDSFLLFVNAGEALRLAASSLILMLPFACGALAIGLIFISGVERIGSYYFANMLGSGVGCILGLSGLAWLPAELLPPLCGLLALMSALPLLKGSKRIVQICALTSFACTVAFLLVRPGLALSQYKDLRKTLDLPGAEIIEHGPSTFGQLHIVEAPMLRSATGLSLLWQAEMPPSPAVFVNGDMVGSIPPETGLPNPSVATTAAMPFAIKEPGRTLVLNAGTGQSVALALEHGESAITAVEPHRGMFRTLSRLTRHDKGSAFSSDKVQWHNDAPRTWLARDKTRYDLIVLPNIGSFGGGAGLFALHEQPLLTKEALKRAWQALSPEGFLTVTTWVDYPPRSPLRLLATLVELLEEEDAVPADHIAAVRSWGTLTFCIKRTPLNRQELAAARAFAEQWAFDTALLPEIATADREKFNRLQDNSIFTLMDALFAKEEREQLYRDYPFRITPTIDDRPFFSQFLRWSMLDGVIKHFGQRTVPFIELGSLVAGVSAAILTFLAALLILLPLVKLKNGGGLHLKTFIYFGGLGIGYMWTELALIHRFEFYLGQPVYSAALVVAVLLIGSGVGSFLTERFKSLQPCRYAVVIILMLGGYALGLESLLQQTLPWGLSARTGVAIAVLAPTAVFMGMPFPLGLRLLNQVKTTEVPWAWGINGCLSVAGAAMATIIAVETGYSVMLLLATGAYLFSALSALKPG